MIYSWNLKVDDIDWKNERYENGFHVSKYNLDWLKIYFIIQHAFKTS